MSNYSNERKSYSLILIILLLVIAIIAAAFGGYSWWALKHAKSGTTGTSQQKVIPAPVFMSLEPFTINLIDEEEHLDRVLYIGITLRLHDENTRKRLHDYLPEVRSRLLLLLSRQHANKIATDAGKQQLMTEIKETLRPTLVPGESDRSSPMYCLPRLFCDNHYER